MMLTAGNRKRRPSEQTEQHPADPVAYHTHEVLLGAFGSAHHIQHKADNQKQRQRRPKIGNVLFGEPSPPGHGHQPVHGDLFRRLSFRGHRGAARCFRLPIRRGNHAPRDGCLLARRRDCRRRSVRKTHAFSLALPQSSLLPIPVPRRIKTARRNTLQLYRLYYTISGTEKQRDSCRNLRKISLRRLPAAVCVIRYGHPLRKT